jgi:hypothetical protein
MRKEFEMTEEQLEKLLKACAPVPYLVIGGVVPRSPQENANAAWQELAREMGFQWDSVQPVPGKPPRFFTAEEAVQ